MTARRIGLKRCGPAGLLGSVALMFATGWAAGQSPTTGLRATETFRSAVALENRGLYDLAADEWAAMLAAHPHDPRAQQARLHRGVCLFALEQYAEAAGEFERLLVEGKSLDNTLREQAQVNLGLAYYNLGRTSSESSREQAFAAALAAFASQLQQFSDGSLAPQAVFYQAEIAYSRGDLATAIVGYQDFVAKYDEHPLRAQALYALGVAQQEAEQPAVAADTLQRFLFQYPDHAQVADAHLRFVESLFARAQSEQREGRLADANVSLSVLLSTYPHHELARTARLMRASVRYELRRYEDALHDVRTVLATRPPRAVQSDALLVRGMCQAALDRPADAIQTFASIVNDDPTHSATDRVLYELAWAYTATTQPERATATFQRLATSCPASPLAAEGWYRVGESQFAANEFAGAAASFQSARRLSNDAELQERAAHKRAWALFSQNQFAAAEQAFAEQLSQFATGLLAADARIMVAESRFAVHDYAAAFEHYESALEQSAGSREVRGVALLHAAQAANQIDKWTASLEFLERCEREFPDNRWTAEIRCERGWGLYHQEQLDAAWREFESVAGARGDALGARARFMLGEIQFARKQYDAAVRTFFQVAYGYGGIDAPPAFRRWQAEATFEAARCLEQTRRHESARKLYRELLTYYPESAKAAHARVALDGLKTR